MRLYLGMLLVSFVLTCLFCLPYINFLYQNKFVRKKETEEKRKTETKEFRQIRATHSHKAGTPTGLGLLLILLICAIFTVFFPLVRPMPAPNLFSNFPPSGELLAIFTTFLGFGVVGLSDDLVKVFGFSKTKYFGLKRRHKLILQLLVAFIVSSILYRVLGIKILHLPFFSTFDLGIFYIPLSALFITTLANAFDITSGLDGLGEGLLIISLFAFFIIAEASLDHISLLFISVWLGALIAGTYFTIHPARAFLGNASGLAFGSTLAVLGLLSGKVIPTIVVSGIFLLEFSSSLLQIVSKTVFQKQLFPIAPIHHWLELIGWEEPKIVTRAWLAGIVLSIFGVWLALI